MSPHSKASEGTRESSDQQPATSVNLNSQGPPSQKESQQQLQQLSEDIVEKGSASNSNNEANEKEPIQISKNNSSDQKMEETKEESS